MKFLLPLLAMAALFLTSGGCAQNETGGATIPPRCTPEWNQLVDKKLEISDSAGHGPDIGSAEWMYAVGRKSGVVDASGHGPDPGSDEWCRAVDYKVFGRR